MVFILETERLILRELQLTDAENIFSLNNDPDVLRYTGDNPFPSISEATEFLAQYNHYQLYGYGRWAVETKADNEFIGWCGLKYNELKKVDLGFRLYKNKWGKGYATEASAACLSHGFANLHLHEIIARANIHNMQSINVIEKIGMKEYLEPSIDVIPNWKYYHSKRKISISTSYINSESSSQRFSF